MKFSSFTVSRPDATFNHNYFQLAQGHRIVILNAMEAIVQDNGAEIDKPLAVEIIKQALVELLGSKVGNIGLFPFVG